MILVGHSYGGAVITNGAVGDPQVKALVYVDAFIPDQGETLLDLVSAQPGSCLGGNQADMFNLVPYPSTPQDVDTYIKPSLRRTQFALFGRAGAGARGRRRISDGAVPAFPRPALSAAALRPAVDAIGPLVTLGNSPVTVR